MRKLGISFLTFALLVPAPGQTRLIRDPGDVLLQQNDGSYQSVHIGEHGPYSVQTPYPGADWAPVYDDSGNRVGTIENQANGSSVFYDNRGDRR